MERASIQEGDRKSDTESDGTEQSRVGCRGWDEYHTAIEDRKLILKDRRKDHAQG